MIAKDLIREVAKRTSITVSDANIIVNSIFDTIKDYLNTDGEVKIHNFGSFKVKYLKGKTGLNTDGVKCKRSGVHKVRFAQSKSLDQLLNGDKNV